MPTNDTPTRTQSWMSKWRPYLLAGSFCCACLNMLASGSLYVYALYAPSFTRRLGYSQTQTSLIAVIGDIGLYGVGPVTGLMADRLGPRPTSFVAALLLALGYCLLSAGYSRGLDEHEHGQPPTHFLLMSVFLLLAGVGSSASYMAAFTSLAKNFKRARGLALGIPVSFFGLSAALLTMVAQSFFTMSASSPLNGLFYKSNKEEKELDTVNFLLFLGVSGGLFNFLSIFGLNIWPQPTAEEDEEEEVSSNGDDHTILEPSLLQEAGAFVREQPQPHSHDHTHEWTNSEQTPLLRETTAVEDPTATTSATPIYYKTEVVSVSGKAFFLDRDAQYFFFIMICLAGTGLMIINSITAMVDTVALSERGDPLWMFNKPAEETTPVASMRAKHVGLISVSSYFGRILAGLGSDIAISRYGAQRIYVLPVATATMGLAQIVGMFASLQWLYACSILAGIAYGGYFGVAGIIVAELWGEETCGQNWGWLSWGAAFGGMLFNLLFGLVMDAARPIVDGEPQACKGHGCFRWALVGSLTACLLSCALSIRMGIRQKRRALLAGR